MSVNITVDSVAYPVPSSAADTNWAAQQVAFEQALVAYVDSIAALSIPSFTNDSATPGNRTVNKVHGKNAFAIGASECVITNNLVTASSQIVVTLESEDATLEYIRYCTPGVGSFLVGANDVATAAATFSWTVINP